MPYIDKVMRVVLSTEREAVRDPMTPGELNYMLTCTVMRYYKQRVDYQAINDILGALEGAKLEFYRRVAAPYEDKKKVENGDVY